VFAHNGQKRRMTQNDSTGAVGCRFDTVAYSQLTDPPGMVSTERGSPGVVGRSIMTSENNVPIAASVRITVTDDVRMRPVVGVSAWSFF